MTNAAINSLKGISADGNGMVQTKEGGGYILLRREDFGPWQRVAESRYYSDACSALDQIDAQ